MKKTLKKIGIFIFGSIFSLLSLQYVSNLKNDKKIVNILNATIQSIEKKESTLSFLNLLPIFPDYSPIDTLFVHRKQIDFEYEIFYDRLLTSEELNLKMDSEFYEQIVSFKIRHKVLTNRYSNKPNDLLRNRIKKDITLQMLEEKEILNGEIDYLEDRISKDSLWTIRNTTFRKYVNYDL